MTRTLVNRVLAPDLVVSRESFESPTNEEWEEFLKLLKSRGEHFAKLRILVVTDGGGPNAPQRKLLEETLKGRPVRVAIVTDSAKSRFIASAVSLFNRDHKGFAKGEIQNAYRHLGLTPSECRSVESAIRELDPMVG
jgi:hypothetical protein